MMGARSRSVALLGGESAEQDSASEDTDAMAGVRRYQSCAGRRSILTGTAACAIMR